MKKVLINGLIIGLIIVLIAFIPGAGNRLLSWLVPPRLYILLAVIVILILWKILIELRNRNVQDQEPSSDDDPAGTPFKSENGMFYYEPAEEPSAPSAPCAPPPRKVWSEDIETFLGRNPNAKQIKLVGKPEEFAFCEVGNRCHVYADEDDPEKYNVFCGDDLLGRLPSSAVTYAEKNDCPPEDLAVIIAEIDYDLEKERDIISVYISD